ncbi:MAG: SH3 domain-containing protein [Nitrospirales bacterium]|nr:SH3 domain-containing protein [Nitrospirales bacterium]
MMTSTFPPFPHSTPLPKWSLLLAEEPNKDLEFDEGLEEDDLDQSKPPSRKPLLWIVLLLLAVGIAYWSLKPETTMNTQVRSMDSAETVNTTHPPKANSLVPSPKFLENQTVSLTSGTGEALLLLDPQTGKPGSIVKTGEALTILDGTLQDGNWMYQVKTKSGQIGWLSGSKLQKTS